MLKYRRIEPSDDERIAEIIRANLEKAHLDIPGTAYFDPELDHLSAYDRDEVIGGVGVAEFDGIDDCAELQKLYLDDSAKGKGLGKALIQLAINWAASSGYKNLYLETHTGLAAALNLYEKTGFRQIEKPCPTTHGTMNRFYLKTLLHE